MSYEIEIIEDLELFPGERDLLCPACGFEYTHIDQVEVSTASGQIMTILCTGEDENSRMTTKLEPTEAPVNRSSRRHSFALVGTCEGCTRTFTLSFTQHKGVTEVHVATTKE